MKIASNSEMRLLDSSVIQNTGLPGIVLMERAAECAARRALSLLSGKRNVLVFCGKGNNGGDGFAAARILHNKGIDAEIIFLGDTRDITGDAKINFDVCRNLNMKILECAEFTSVITEKLKDSDLVIDAIFGTGLSGAVKEPQLSAIKAINESEKPVLSIDIPSGVSGDTGKVLGACVRADETVACGMPKPGLLLYPGAEFAGKIRTADISIPPETIERSGLKGNILTVDEARGLLPKRPLRTNKGTFGKTYVIAGSETMAGASALCCKAAYNMGSGLVYACIPKELLPVIQCLVPEAVEIVIGNLPTFLENLDGASAVVLGPGLGQGRDARELVFSVLEKASPAPLIIDADGLNIVSGRLETLKKAGRSVIVTPHPGEMSRLTGKPIGEILDDTITAALEFSKEYGVITVLKDARTIIATPDGQYYINCTGNPAMAKGGAGDVLSGIVAGLAAQGAEPFMASVLGVYIHGLAGDLARDVFGERSVSAGDICAGIYRACMEIAGKNP